MNDNQEVVVREEFDEEVVRQFETVRACGAVNMMDRHGVGQVADGLEFYGLAAISGDSKEYGRLLHDFGRLMDKYGIGQK
jgi:hypothetical protein